MIFPGCAPFSFRPALTCMWTMYSIYLVLKISYGLSVLDIMVLYPQFKKPGNGPILLHNIGPTLPAGKRMPSFAWQRAAWMLTTPMAAVEVVYRIFSSDHYHSHLLKNNPDSCFVFGWEEGNWQKEGVSFWDFPLPGVALWMVHKHKRVSCKQSWLLPLVLSTFRLPFAQ